MAGITSPPVGGLGWLSAIGYRLSAIGYRLSAIGYRLSAIGYRLSAIGYQLSAIGTDLTNPVSNHLYARIGFDPV